MGYGRPRGHFLSRGAFPRQRVEKRPIRVDPKLDRANAPKQAKAAGRAGNMAVVIEKGSIWHSDQAKAVFSFLQENVVPYHFM